MTELVLLSESHDCADERRGAMYGCLRQMCGMVLESIYARKSSVGVAPSEQNDGSRTVVRYVHHNLRAP